MKDERKAEESGRQKQRQVQFLIQSRVLEFEKKRWTSNAGEFQRTSNSP